jgi:hypothetical protein
MPDHPPSPAQPAAPDLIDPVQGAIQIAAALKAAGFTAPQIAQALVSADVYPLLTALQLGSVLIDPQVFPDLSRDDLTAALAATERYTAQQIADAVAALFARPRAIGPVGGGDFYYGPPIDFNDLTFALQVGQPITALNLRAGDIIDAIQAVYGGGQPAPSHGGDGGTLHQVLFQPADLLATVKGYYGTWFEAIYIVQLTLVTRSGQVFGPYGMQTPEGYSEFSFDADPDEHIVAFFGQVAPGLRYNVPPTLFVDQLGVYAKRL